MCFTRNISEGNLIKSKKKLWRIGDDKFEIKQHEQQDSNKAVQTMLHQQKLKQNSIISIKLELFCRHRCSKTRWLINTNDSASNTQIIIYSGKLWGKISKLLIRTLGRFSQVWVNAAISSKNLLVRNYSQFDSQAIIAQQLGSHNLYKKTSPWSKIHSVFHNIIKLQPHISWPTIWQN